MPFSHEGGAALGRGIAGFGQALAQLAQYRDTQRRDAEMRAERVAEREYRRRREEALDAHRARQEDRLQQTADFSRLLSGRTAVGAAPTPEAARATASELGPMMPGYQAAGEDFYVEPPSIPGHDLEGSMAAGAPEVNPLFGAALEREAHLASPPDPQMMTRFGYRFDPTDPESLAIVEGAVRRTDPSLIRRDEVGRPRPWEQQGFATEEEYLDHLRRRGDASRATTQGQAGMTWPQARSLVGDLTTPDRTAPGFDPMTPGFPTDESVRLTELLTEGAIAPGEAADSVRAIRERTAPEPEERGGVRGWIERRLRGPRGEARRTREPEQRRLGGPQPGARRPAAPDHDGLGPSAGVSARDSAPALAREALDAGVPREEVRAALIEELGITPEEADAALGGRRLNGRPRKPTPEQLEEIGMTADDVARARRWAAGRSASEAREELRRQGVPEQAIDLILGG